MKQEEWSTAASPARKTWPSRPAAFSYRCTIVHLLQSNDKMISSIQKHGFGVIPYPFIDYGCPPINSLEFISLLYTQISLHICIYILKRYGSHWLNNTIKFFIFFLSILEDIFLLHVLADREQPESVWLHGEHCDESLAGQWRICLESRWNLSRSLPSGLWLGN